MVSEDGLQLVGQLDGPAPFHQAQPLPGPVVPSFSAWASAHLSSDPRSELARERLGGGASALEEPKVLVDGPRMRGVNVGEEPLGVVGSGMT